MARKELDITIDDDGRDRGKVFHLREMSAWQAERWAIRALLALSKAGADIGGAEPGAGVAAFAATSFRALLSLDFADAEPLLIEMLECISIKPDPRNPNVVRALLPEDIEEVATLIKLRKEVFTLHVGFSQPGAQ